MGLVGLHRDPKHHYSWNDGPWYPGITSVIDMLDKSGPLIGWAKKVVANAALKNLDAFVQLARLSPDQARTFLVSRPDYERDTAADLGTRVHAIAELIGKAEEPVDIAPDEAARALSYRGWIAAHNPTFVLTEFMVYSETHRYGGTMDVSWYLPCEVHHRDCLWFVDYKTGKGVYAKTAMQLAAGANADWIGRTDDPTQYAITKPDHYGVLHVTNDFCKLIEFDVTDQEWEAFRACRFLYDWNATRASKVMLPQGRPRP